MRERLTETLQRERSGRSWVRDLRMLILWQLASVTVGIVAWVLVEGGRPSIRGMTLLLLLTALTAGCAAVRPGRREMQLLVLATCASVLSAPLWTAPSVSPHAFFASASCVAGELAVAIVPAAFALLAVRRFAARAEQAALAGVAAAATGLVVLDATCDLRDLSHVAAFHLAPSALVVLAVALVRACVRSDTFSP